jgi:hypothetical protein
MCDDNMNCCCCLQGPQGVQGLQGAQGIQGVPGAQGIPGQNGVQGVQGLQGPMGTPGTNATLNSAYLSVYSLTNQTLAPGASPLLEAVNQVSAATDFDISQASISGQVKVINHGIYSMAWGFDGLLTPPYPFPVPGWSLGVYRNGLLLPGSTAAAFSISPDEFTVHTSSDGIFEFMAGDILKLVNTSTSSINAVSTFLGSNVPVAAASLSIVLLKALP